MAVKRVVVLGATGSIGASTADVIARHPDRFRAWALVGHRNVARMAELVERLAPEHVVMTDAEAARALAERLQRPVDAGMEAAEALAAHSEADIVVAAMVGAAGIPAALAAVRAGKHLALANKECLVAAGRLFVEAARASGARIVPVDSEHAAVHQLLAGRSADEVVRVILTASGGPFLDREPSSLADVTPEEAVAHPNWSMGAKISVDSATMMNKALELIEARWLFGLGPEKLSAVIHRQSLVHALVELVDGVVMAQIAEPDMRAPIAYALSPEERLKTGIARFDLSTPRRLDFEPVDEERFPAMRLVRSVLKGPDSWAIAFNAANEEANAAFRARKIGFLRIVPVVEEVLARIEPSPTRSLDDVYAVDQKARALAQEVIAR